MSDAFWIALFGGAALIVPALMPFVMQKLNAIHKLVNGSMTIQLKAYALLAHRMADETGTSVDIKAAEEADAALAEHIANEEK